MAQAQLVRKPLSSMTREELYDELDRLHLEFEMIRGRRPG